MIPRLAERAREVTAAQRARGLDTEGSWLRRGRGVVAVAGANRARCHRRGGDAHAGARDARLHPPRPSDGAVAPHDSAVQRLARWGVLAALIALGGARLAGCCRAEPARASPIATPAPSTTRSTASTSTSSRAPSPGWSGPAEAGKSTLCLVAGGLAPRVVGGRLTGQVGIDGASVARLAHASAGRAGRDRRCRIRRDSSRSSPRPSLDEVAFGPANLGLPRDEVVERVEEALRLAGIEALRERDPRAPVGRAATAGGHGRAAGHAPALPRARRAGGPPRRGRGTTRAGRRRVPSPTPAPRCCWPSSASPSCVGVADSMVVMAAGNIVARGPAGRGAGRPRHARPRRGGAP